MKGNGMDNYIIQIQSDLIDYSQRLNRAAKAADEIREMHRDYVSRLGELDPTSNEYHIVLAAAAATELCAKKLGEAIHG